MPPTDLALQPVTPNLHPGPQYHPCERKFQGIASIERSRTGRLWATWYSGGSGEGGENYVLLASSADDGRNWIDPLLVIDPPLDVRAFDPTVWIDPLGRLWLFWAQSQGLYDGRAGVWTIRCDDPARADAPWTAPRRIGNGIMMNKPTALADGRWLAPAAVWARLPLRDDMAAERFSNVLASADQGATWNLCGSADVSDRSYDEHMVVQRRDGSLWMLVRTRYGIGESFSFDGGKTWTPGKPSSIAGPGSRFFIRRLASGRLLLVNHLPQPPAIRTNMAAFLSDDDGATWPHRLLLDANTRVSYPDATEAADGRIFIIYDFNRGDKPLVGTQREIRLAIVREHDILQGRLVSPDAALEMIVSKGG